MPTSLVQQMEASLVRHSPSLPPLALSGRRRPRLFHRRYRPAIPRLCAAREREGDDPPGRTVDANMTTLRERIMEVKSLDRADRRPLAAAQLSASDWEKECTLTLYESRLVEVLGQMQLQLMMSASSLDGDRGDVAARPRLAVGFAVMVTVSVPVPVLVVAMHLADAAKGIMEVMQLKGGELN